jgi:hypothetical protein
MRKYTPDTFPVTISADALAKRPVVKLPPSYHLGDPGSACFGDPPGYPSYYVRPVYTSHGNGPPRNSKCPDYVLPHSDGTLRAVPEEREALFKALYVPLPLNHPRVQAWIDQTMKHFCHCYQDEERPEYGRPGTLIYPLPHYKLRSTHSPHPDIKVRSAEQRAAKVFNHVEEERAAKIATLDNHMGVRSIRAIYPGWVPPLPLGAYRDIPYTGNWWETAEAP